MPRQMINDPPLEVAVVDDDAAVLASFRFMLELAGFPVSTYASARAYLDRSGRALRCIILDHHMPTMTGLKLIARLRADGILIPVMLITSAPSPAIVARAAEANVRVLEKPPTEKELIWFVTSCS